MFVNRSLSVKTFSSGKYFLTLSGNWLYNSLRLSTDRTSHNEPTELFSDKLLIEFLVAVRLFAISE